MTKLSTTELVGPAKPPVQTEQNAQEAIALPIVQSKTAELVPTGNTVTSEPTVIVHQAFETMRKAKVDRPDEFEKECSEIVFWVAQALEGLMVPYTKANEMIVSANQASNYLIKLSDLTNTVKHAYGYETESLFKLVEKMNKIHAVINIGGKFRIMKMGIDPDTGLSDFTFSTPSDFKAFYANRKVQIGEAPDATLGTYWFGSRWRREFEGITFNPQETPEGYFNLWTGFAVEPKAGNCSKFLSHIEEVIASGNKVIFNYIIAWMADCVQNPAVLPGVAVVLRGSMGTGKGVFASGFGSLFGRHYMPLAQGSQLTGRFNDHMKDKVLLFADEAFWAGDKAAEGVLKSLITEPSIVIEGKGENAFKIRNHLHFIFATNNSWCVPAGAQERRFFVVDVSEKYMQDSIYFGAIQNELANGGREALLYYLQNFDLSGIELRDYPQTSALMEQKVSSMAPVEKFWYSRLQSGVLANNGTAWDKEISVQTLYGDFIKTCADQGIRHRPSVSEFGTQIHKLVPEITTGRGKANTYGPHRPNVYKVPALITCRKTFEKQFRYQIEWPVFDDPDAITATATIPNTTDAVEQ